MSYQTQREKVKTFIEETIIPAIKKSKSDPSYFLLINSIAETCSVSNSVVEDILKSMVIAKKLEVYVSLPEQEIINWLKEIQKEKIEKEAENILQEQKQQEKNDILPYPKG